MVDLYGKEEIKAFLDELNENLEFLDEAIMALEKEPGDKENLTEIFRVAHTVKGSAGFLALDNLVELGHAMESVFMEFGKGGLKVSKEAIDVLLECKDAISEIGNALAQSKDTTKIKVAHLVKAVNGFLDKVTVESDRLEKPSEPKQEEESAKEVIEKIKVIDGAILVKIYISESEVVPSVRAFLVKKKLTDIGEVIDQEPNQDYVDSEEFSAQNQRIVNYWLKTEYKKDELPKLIRVDLIDKIEVFDKEDIIKINKEVDQVIEKKVSGRKESKEDFEITDTVRIPVTRLDTLLNLVGELVIANSGFLQIQDDLKAKREIEIVQRSVRERVKELFRISSDIQELVMKSRMVAVSNVFNRFKRFVRDYISKSGKKINLEIKGEETEIDKKIVDEIFKPLTHIIRNSLDHGIESPKDRSDKGKVETGTLKLNAYQEGNYINIEIEDDGQGLNFERIIKKAIKNGLVTEEDSQNLTEEEICGFIFKAGFSTKEKADDISGRGIGMDIVKSSVEALNGVLDIDSFVDQGTKVTIKLPLTLSILNALIVKVGTDTFSIPMNSIIETQKVRATQILTIEGEEMVKLRDSLIPLIRLNEVFELKSSEAETETEYSVIIVENNETLVSLLVDEFIARQEMVIKSLAEHYRTIEGISGASIMGDGNIILIVDVQGVVQIYRDKRNEGETGSYDTALEQALNLSNPGLGASDVLYVEPKFNTDDDDDDEEEGEFKYSSDQRSYDSMADGLINEIIDKMDKEESEALESNKDTAIDRDYTKGIAFQEEVSVEAIKKVQKLFDKKNPELLREWLRQGNKRAVEGLQMLTGRVNVRIGKSRAKRLNSEKIEKFYSQINLDDNKIDFLLPVLPLNGHLHFILSKKNARKTVRALLDQANLTEMEESDLEPLMEVTNIIGSAYTNSLTTVTGVSVEPGVPEVIEGQENIKKDIENLLRYQKYSLLYIENQFVWDNEEIFAELLIMLPEMVKEGIK